MWIITDRGFYSTVDKGDREGYLCVRARVREDLERLCELAPMAAYSDQIEQNEMSDYRYRVYARRGDWAAALEQLGREIDYPNFKDAVEDRQGSRRAGHYYSVWNALARLQE